VVPLTLFVALTPLFILAGVNYYLFKKNMRSELFHQVSQDLSNTSRSLESVIEERLSALRLIAREETIAELSEHARTEKALQNLKSAFGGFVDLGLIDSRGRQISYSGPYSLEGENYQNEKWFHQVLHSDFYVSDVFTGHRKLPHFVVVVKQGSYLLRATVEMELLNRLLFIPGMGGADDVFIVSRAGLMQTTSRLHGDILDQCPLPVPPYSPQDEVIEDFDDQGISYSLGYSYIEETPFVLIVIRKRADLLYEWFRSNSELIGFLIGSTIVIFVVVLWSLTSVVKRIRTGDLQRAQMLENIEYTNKMAAIGRLAASVAHEINNPLAIINEKAGLVSDILSSSDDIPCKERLSSAIVWIQKSVERCGEVTHRLLGFTRKVPVRREPLDLRELLTEVLEFLQKEATHRNVVIETDFPQSFPEIESDRGQLQQVFLNIINNAFAAVAEGGWIRLSLQAIDPHHVSVAVEDNGCGISEEHLKQVFEPFFSTKGEFGTGLGLTITYNLVRKLGAQIEVKSELGEGSCFTVILPTGRQS
jgi:signal transduction histidine kinase